MTEYDLVYKIKKYKIPIAKGALVGLATFFILNGGDAAYHHTSLIDIVQDLPRSIAWHSSSIIAGIYEFVRSI